MLQLIICGLFILIIPNVECKFDYDYHPQIEGWLKLHKVPVTWQVAFFQCYNEGAMLASPLTEELLDVMKTVVDGNDNSSSYFIGTHSRFSPGQFVSMEGIPLENMPITDMFKLLNADDGECLSTDGRNINVVSCTKRLPYMCFMKKEMKTTMSACGTFDEEYRLDTSTNKCYKLHKEFRTWADANSVCIAEGGHLAVLNNDLEALVVRNMIPATVSPSGNKARDSLWIGLRDWTGNGVGTWMSIHGEPIEKLYRGWHTQQPDASGELCAGLLRDGTMDNGTCQFASYFVCEKDPKNTRYEGHKK